MTYTDQTWREHVFECWSCGDVDVDAEPCPPDEAGQDVTVTICAACAQGTLLLFVCPMCHDVVDTDVSPEPGRGQTVIDTLCDGCQAEMSDEGGDA